MTTLPVNFQTRQAAEIAADVKYAVNSARYFIDRFGPDIAGKCVLEIGPGVNFGFNLILASLGARCIVADRFLSPWNDAYHPQFYAALKAEIYTASAIDRVLNQGSYDGVLQLVPEPAEALTSIPTGSVDIVYSNAVLEHIVDVGAVGRELVRISADDVWHSHQIDMRDHSSFARPLEHMLVGPLQWKDERARTHCERGTQLRISDFIAGLEEAGLTVTQVIEYEYASDEYFADFLKRLRQSQSAYKNNSWSDLRILSAQLILRKF